MLSRLGSGTIRDLFRVLSGNVVVQAIGLLLSVILSRSLGPAEYGVFASGMAVYIFFTQLSDFGVSVSFITHGSKIRQDPQKYADFFFTSLISKAVLALAVGLVFSLFSDRLALFFFKSGQYATVLSALGFSVFFYAIFSMITLHYQATQQFGRYSGLNILNQIVKLIGALGIIFMLGEKASSIPMLYVYGYSTLAALVLYICLSPKHEDLRKGRFDRRCLGTIFGVGVWVLLSSVLVTVIMRLDIMMLQRLSSGEEVGYYAVALQIAQVFPLLAASVTATIMPKLSDYLLRASIKDYVSVILRKSRYIFFLFLAVEILSPYLIVLVFGQSYEKSVPVFQALSAAFMLCIVTGPISILFYTMGKAHVLTVLNLLQLIVNYGANLYLIPKYAAVGAALSTCLTYFLGGGVSLYLALRAVNDSVRPGVGQGTALEKGSDNVHGQE